MPLLPTVGGKAIVFSGRLSGRPSIHLLSVHPYVNTYFPWCNISLLSGRISVELATNRNV